MKPLPQDKFIAVAIRFAEANRADDLFPATGLWGAMDEFYESFDSPVNPPLAVKRAIVLKFLDEMATARRILGTLGYDGLGKFYYFTHVGMYHGVEPDGCIHT